MAETKEPKKDIWAELSKPFPKEAISKMPRGGVQLDYVGHAATTDRLNTVLGADGWNWEPMAFDEDGTPKIVVRGQQATLWGWFYVKDVKRPAVGSAMANKTELEKELIGDLIRNGAMRFGVALELWSKDELESNIDHTNTKKTADPFPPEEPSRDIHEDVPESKGITPETITKLAGALKLKGFTDKKAAMNILNNLSKSEFGAVVTAISEENGEALYRLISKTAKGALEMLTEEE